MCPIYIESLKNLEERERYEKTFQRKIEQHEGHHEISYSCVVDVAVTVKPSIKVIFKWIPPFFIAYFGS